jgi:hypothetical protein
METNNEIEHVEGGIIREMTTQATLTEKLDKINTDLAKEGLSDHDRKNLEWEKTQIEKALEQFLQEAA